CWPAGGGTTRTSSTSTDPVSRSAILSAPPAPGCWPPACASWAEGTAATCWRPCASAAAREWPRSSRPPDTHRPAPELRRDPALLRHTRIYSHTCPPRNATCAAFGADFDDREGFSTSCGTKPFVIMGKRDSGATLVALTLAAEAG